MAITGDQALNERQIVVHIGIETRAGFKYLVVRVMQREVVGDGGQLANHPLSIAGGIYAEDRPFAGLEMAGYFGKPGEVIGFRTMYYQAHFIELDRAQAMAKMLAKIQREMFKAQATEVGDTFMVFCKAIGAKGVAINLTPERTSLTDAKWRFGSLEDGRDRLRHLCANQHLS